jgi:hypothetical protein
MAHTIDEVWEQCQDIKTALTALNDLHPIKVTLNTLVDPTKMLRLWVDCDKCHGDGLVLDFAGPYGIDPLDVVLPLDENPFSKMCPKCKGAKRFPFGWQETNPVEYP